MPHGTLPGYFKDLRRPSEQAGVDTPAAGEPPGPLPAPPPRGAIPGSGAAAEPHPPVPHQNQTGERGCKPSCGHQNRRALLQGAQVTFPPGGAAPPPEGWDPAIAAVTQHRVLTHRQHTAGIRWPSSRRQRALPKPLADQAVGRGTPQCRRPREAAILGGTLGVRGNLLRAPRAARREGEKPVAVGTLPSGTGGSRAGGSQDGESPG